MEEQAGSPETAVADGGEPSFTSPVAVQTIDESEYEPQLQRKLEQLKGLLGSLGEPLPPIEVFESARQHYRMRAEFTTWGVRTATDGPQDVHFVMFESGSKVKPPPMIRVDQFPVGSKLINELMAGVVAEANASPVIRERLFQANFHTGLSGDSMVTLLYHKKLDDVWREAATALRAKLAKLPGTNGHTPQIIGRSRKQKVELDHGWITERLQVNGAEYAYRQVEGSFSQPNAGVCQHMLSWAQRVTQPGYASPHTSQAAAAPTSQALKGPQPLPGIDGPPHSSGPEAATQPGPDAATQPGPDAATQPGPACSLLDGSSSSVPAEDSGAAAPEQAADQGAAAQPTSDLLELYCGNGNFTIPLAKNFRRVVATELSKSSVDAAKHNMLLNGVTNMFVARMSSEEFSEAWRTKATKKRLDGLGDWDSLSLDTVLVDPPRAGLDSQTVEMVSQFQRVVYISCNPETLVANLKDLMPTHRILDLAAFDQFPYTHHLECGVYLARRS